MTHTGIEQGGGAKHRNQSPSGALVSPGVPPCRNVYCGCCIMQPVRGIEGTRPPAGGKKRARWALFLVFGSQPVGTSTEVAAGKLPPSLLQQIHLPQRGRLLGREAKLCHLNNTAPAEPCASVHGSAGAVCHLIGCFPECKPRCPPARRPGRRLRRRSALRGRGSPTGPP